MGVIRVESSVKRVPLWPIFLVVLWGYILTPGAIAGRFNPVVTDVSLTATSDLSNPEWVWVAGRFQKHRDGCNPLRMEWRLGDRSGANSPVDYIWGAPRVRPSGLNTFYNWRVRVPQPSLLLHFTHADVIHQCGFTFSILGNETRVNFPWETVTPFWDFNDVQ